MVENCFPDLFDLLLSNCNFVHVILLAFERLLFISFVAIHFLLISCSYFARRLILLLPIVSYSSVAILAIADAVFRLVRVFL